MHRLDPGLYFHLKEFWGNGARTHVNSKEKSLLPEKNSPQRKMEPTTLHRAGQRAQHTTNELFRPLKKNKMYTQACGCVDHMVSFELPQSTRFYPQWSFVRAIFSPGDSKCREESCHCILSVGFPRCRLKVMLTRYGFQAALAGTVLRCSDRPTEPFIR